MIRRSKSAGPKSDRPKSGRPKSDKPSSNKSSSSRTSSDGFDSDADAAIVFDGGSKGNPGFGYGSYRLKIGGGDWMPAARLEFGDRITNNEAEYLSMVAAFEELAQLLDNPTDATVAVFGDSQLVLFQMEGKWRVKAGNLKPINARAHTAARKFGRVTYNWHRRDASVDLLGH